MKNVQLLLVLCCGSLVTCVKNFKFAFEKNKRYATDIIDTLTARSARQCTLRCIGTTACRITNWKEDGAVCELVGAYGDPVDAVEYNAYSRK